MQTSSESDLKIAINRFTSSLAAAFRTFYLYHNNNKALDEIMDNLVARAKEASEETFKLGLTNRSVVYQGDPVGDPGLTQHFAYQLRILGIKEIIFRPPLHGRHFFQILNIISSHDPAETKAEKLNPFFGDEEQKPISFVPITSNSILLRLTDDLLKAKLEPLTHSVNQDGKGLMEELTAHPPHSLGDLYSQIAVRSEGLEKSLRVFIRNLIDATREGYFPYDRFFNVFPLPPHLKTVLLENLINTHHPIDRKETSLGLACHPNGHRSEAGASNWNSFLVAFSKVEIKERHDLTMLGIQQQGLAELELAYAMLKDSGLNFNLGLKILIRVLNQKHPTSIQEKALKIGLATWLQHNKSSDDMALLSQLSGLRQSLALPHNIALALFPIRSLQIESELFQKISSYLVTLGDVIISSLIKSLEAEEDRSMRKKLCLILTAAVREQGTSLLLQSLDTAPPFLLRNLIMILGDVRSQEALQNLSDLTNHSQKIVRVEALRSLGKIGSTESIRPLLNTLEKNLHSDEKIIALELLAARRDRSVVDVLIRLARHEDSPSVWKNELIKAMGAIGGPMAKTYLESLIKKGSLLSNLNSHVKEEQNLLQTILKRMNP